MLDDDDRASPPPKVARSLGQGASPGSSTSLLSALEAPDDPAEALFEALVSSFRASVLPTYKCRCVQFLLFYTCSFDAAFARSFLQLLLEQMTAEHVHAEARMACASYIASFLARAKFLPCAFALSTTREIVRWATAYQQVHGRVVHTAGLMRLDGSV